MRFSDGVDGDDLYAILGAPLEASAEDLKRCRRIQAQKWHPDRNIGAAAQARMAAINNAFRTLGDPSARSEYDESLRSAWRAGHAAPSARSRPWSRTREPADQSPRPRPTRRVDGVSPGTYTAASFLRDEGFAVVDNRTTGGVLWVLEAPRLEPVLDTLRDHGIEFEYVSSGGMATENRPAWWTRARD